MSGVLPLTGSVNANYVSLQKKRYIRICTANENQYPFNWGWPEPCMYGVCTVFLAGISPKIRCIHTVLANPTFKK